MVLCVEFGAPQGPAGSVILTKRAMNFRAGKQQCLCSRYLCIRGQLVTLQGFPGGSDGKESACNTGEVGSIPGVGKIPSRREWQHNAVFLPGEFHGQRSLAGSMGL